VLKRATNFFFTEKRHNRAVYARVIRDVDLLSEHERLSLSLSLSVSLALCLSRSFSTGLGDIAYKIRIYFLIYSHLTLCDINSVAGELKISLHKRSEKNARNYLNLANEGRQRWKMVKNICRQNKYSASIMI